MTSLKGYYSLVQYCPDLSRLEAANIGVLLICPDASFADVKLSAGNDRPARFFSRSRVDPAALDAAKSALRNRIRRSGELLMSRDRADAFIGSRGNDIVLSQLRPVKVDEPHETLTRLFRELVGERRPKQSVRLTALDSALRKPGVMEKVRFNQRVRVPIVGRMIRAPYAYQNGALNLIKPERFTGTTHNVTNAAMRLAVEGDLLNRHSVDEGRRAKLIVVADVSGASSGDAERVKQLLDEYRVQMYSSDQIPELVREIQERGHN